MKRNSLFDKNSMDRIENLIIVKFHCLHRHEQLLDHLKGELFPAIKERECSTFFSSMSDILDILIVNFCNEAIRGSCKTRVCFEGMVGEIECILEDIIQREKNSIKYMDAVKYMDAAGLQLCAEVAVADRIREMRNLFEKNRIDFYIGSSMQSLAVDTYSAFEYWMSKIYENLKVNRKNSSKKREIKKILKEHIKEDEKVNEIANELVSELFNYISSKEKIDYILSKAFKGNLDNQERDRVDNIIEFCREQRNTVHNLGIHFGDNKEIISSSGGEIVMRTGKTTFTDDYVNQIEIYREVVEIYWSIISNYCFQNKILDSLVNFA